jgi:hypothetical protein
MSDAVAVSLITTVGGCVVVLLSWVLAKVRKIGSDTSVSRYHLVNDHGDKNLREEQDQRYTAQKSYLQHIYAFQHSADTALGTIRESIQTVVDNDATTRRAIAQLQNRLLIIERRQPAPTRRNTK